MNPLRSANSENGSDHVRPLEIAASGASEAPQSHLEGHDLWPFNEPRCSCSDTTTLVAEFDDCGDGYFTGNEQVIGWTCSGCDLMYTRRRWGGE